MNRTEIIATLRQENPEITERVVTDTILQSWCKEANRNVCALTRCLTDEDGTVIETNENNQSFDLTVHISKFYDIDTFPGSGVLYNDEKLEKATMAELDDDNISWRSNTAGTPEKWYRRGKWLWLDRPIDSNEYDLKVYSILRPDDFDADSKTPFNGWEFLEPYHYSIVLYLKWKAKLKVAKPEEATAAENEYMAYITYMKKMLGGNKFGKILFTPRR